MLAAAIEKGITDLEAKLPGTVAAGSRKLPPEIENAATADACYIEGVRSSFIVRKWSNVKVPLSHT